MKRYKAVFLDWDQTLGDWEGAEYKALQDLYHMYPLTDLYATPEDYISVYLQYNTILWVQYGEGLVSREVLHHKRFLHPLCYARAIDMSTATPEMIQMADDMGADFLRLTNHYFRLLPYARELVEYLSSKYPLTILSNGFKEVQAYKLQHSGLLPFFRHVIISEEVGVNKPQKGIFDIAVQRNRLDFQKQGIGLLPSDCVMIGDSYSNDIMGAKNSGIDQIWFRPQDKQQEGTATYIVTNLAEILDVL